MEVALPPAQSSKTSMNIGAELNRFREKLLDLSNMNRLLNYHKSTTRTIQIIDELPNHIFDRLVTKERSFSFLPKADARDEDAHKTDTITLSIRTIDDEGDHEQHELPPQVDVNGGTSKRHVDDKLQTELSDKRLERTLTVMLACC